MLATVWGVMFWGSVLDSKLDYYLSVTNSLNGAGQTINNDEDRQMGSNPAIVFKTVWHALGEDPGAGLFEGDTDFLEEPAFDIGFHYAFNEGDGDGNTIIVFPTPRTVPRGWLRPDQLAGVAGQPVWLGCPVQVHGLLGCR